MKLHFYHQPTRQRARFVPLPRNFYQRSAVTVARALIGQLLISEENGDFLVSRVVEVEAYVGPHDRAAHSYRDRRTSRTEAMFGPPGHAYVFRLYGLHYNFNVVTGKRDQGQAVLIRAVEPLTGGRAMATRRGLTGDLSVRLTNGPGKLCQAYDIDLRHYGLDLTSAPLYFARPAPGRPPAVTSARRIGVDYAGSWAEKPWRFHEAGNPWVSRARTA